MATGTVKWFKESASGRLTQFHPLRQCPSCPACLANVPFSVSTRLRSVTWRFGDKLGHQLGRHHRRDRRTLLLRTSSIPDAGGQGDARPKRTTAVSALGTGVTRGWRRPVAVLIGSRSLSKDLPEHCSTQGDSRGGT
jgi:hypothetical protein